MTEFDDKPTYEELLLQNAALKEKCNELTKQNENIKKRLNTIQDNFGYEICEYFNRCDSIKETAEYCGYEDIVECGDDLVYFQQCSDYIQSATDYKEYRLLSYGKEEESDEENEENSDNEEDKE
jgi:hypothetical protein